MPLSTNPVSRRAFANRTNVYSTNTPGPWSCIGAKRPASDLDGGLKKRVKINPQVQSVNSINDTSDSDDDSSDVEMENIAATTARVRRRGTVFSMMNAPSMAVPGSRHDLLNTRPILQSFVSSHKADMFKCYSITADAYLTLPYTCAYSNSAKTGGTPHLAVATEQGSVHILNTSKRRDWDFEPQHTTIQPHENGIFDLKWNHSDTLLATASGDLTAHISCVSTQRSLFTLGGHSSTVKCISWDPNHRDLLSTGGRDGSIHIWDLRVESLKERAGIPLLGPVLSIRGAHDNEIKGKSKKRKANIVHKTVTSLAYQEGLPYHLVSSGSYDGILRCWDLRLPLTSDKSPAKTTPTISTSIDPTTSNGSRPRGIITLTQGTGPTSGLLFALAADSRIHTYSTAPSLEPITTQAYSHGSMQTNSFYVRAATSPCGRWLATGGAAAGSAFLYDVSNASRASAFSSPSMYEGHSKGVQLRGQTGDVVAVDWADGMLATCADDGTVRVWRPDGDTYRKCVKDPEESKWDWAWSVAE